MQNKLYIHIILLSFFWGVVYHVVQNHQDSKPLVQPELLPEAAVAATKRLASKENNCEPKDILQALSTVLHEFTLMVVYI